MMITKFRINSLILFVVLPIVLFCGNFSFGIENKTHIVKGTTLKPKKKKVGNEELENWLARLLSPRIDF